MSSFVTFSLAIQVEMLFRYVLPYVHSFLSLQNIICQRNIQYKLSTIKLLFDILYYHAHSHVQNLSNSASTEKQNDIQWNRIRDQSKSFFLILSNIISFNLNLYTLTKVAARFPLKNIQYMIKNIRIIWKRERLYGTVVEFSSSKKKKIKPMMCFFKVSKH